MKLSRWWDLAIAAFVLLAGLILLAGAPTVPGCGARLRGPAAAGRVLAGLRSPRLRGRPARGRVQRLAGDRVGAGGRRPPGARDRPVHLVSGGLDAGPHDPHGRAVQRGDRDLGGHRLPGQRRNHPPRSRPDRPHRRHLARLQPRLRLLDQPHRDAQRGAPAPAREPHGRPGRARDPAPGYRDHQRAGAPGPRAARHDRAEPRRPGAARTALAARARRRHAHRRDPRAARVGRARRARRDPVAGRRQRPGRAERRHRRRPDPARRALHARDRDRGDDLLRRSTGRPCSDATRRSCCSASRRRVSPTCASTRARRPPASSSTVDADEATDARDRRRPRLRSRRRRSGRVRAQRAARPARPGRRLRHGRRHRRVRRPSRHGFRSPSVTA